MTDKAWYTKSREPEPTFTAKRRDLLAKTLMDIVKVLVAVALASKLFGGLPVWSRIAIGIIIVALPICGLLICPKRET